MKTFFSLFLAILAFSVSAQQFGPENIADDSFQSPRTVRCADFNGDGLVDFVTYYAGEGFLYWFENNGDGSFTPVEISTFAALAESLVPADLDGDGDVDLLRASLLDDRIDWYENDGDGNFSSEILITSNVDAPWEVFADDLDGDGDIDVLSSSQDDNKIAWYENDGDGNFSDQIVISSSVSSAISVRTADLNGDGHPDVIASSLADDNIVWFENDGDGNFSTENSVTDFFNGVDTIDTADIDGDGDIDVVASAIYYDKTVWYANDGTGLFSSENIVSTEEDSPESVTAVDIDLDGDVDILLALKFADEIIWYENDGTGVFSSEILIASNTDTVNAVDACDIDLDGDLEVVAAVNNDHKITWYENLEIDLCLNPEACNYNLNGTCCFGTCGCNNPLATNYDEEANCDDGSCVFSITGLVYDDQNLNEMYDDTEVGLPFQSVTISPLGIEVITNDEGMFSFELTGNQEVSLLLADNDVFPFNLTPNPVSFDTETATGTYIEFGISKEFNEFGICVDLYPSGNGFLCNDWSNHNICYRNMGNVPIDGIVEFEYDPLFQGHAEVTPIDSANGNTVYMSFENLLPGQMFFYDVDLLSPTVDFIGEYVTSYARVTGYFQGGQVAYGEQTLETEITCAYDPNDKQAFPIGYTEDHLLLQETEQEFLIRFQNTGNAPAQDVRIQDTLDVNFDLESFKLMANSHSVMTTIDPETRLIDFYFEDIQLPDSVNDEPNSHGLISYKITPLPNLPIGTVLENTAYIYFDNNEPIITNTTWTTIHECGGEAAVTSTASLVCDETLVNFEGAYPLVEIYHWELEGEDAGNEEGIEILPASDSYEVTLVASNPLCTETNSFVYEVPEFELLDPCLADFTCDGQRNTDDLIAFLAAFGCLEACAEDLNGNDAVDTVDLIVFLGLYSRACWE